MKRYFNSTIISRILIHKKLDDLQIVIKSATDNGVIRKIVSENIYAF